MLRTTVLELYEVARSTLWVEDDLTRLFLTEVWSDQQIRVLTAGGRGGVEFLVAGAPRGRVGKGVVGLVDRDFSPDNRASWGNSDARILRTPAHEFENLLLDFDVLSALSGEARATIEEAATARAASIKWWMACKTARYEIFGALAAHFPAEPPAAGMDQHAVTDHLVNSSYWREHRLALASYTPQYVAQRVAQISADYDAHLASGEWVRSFSGKEIFRHVRAEIRGLVVHAKGGSPAENDENLAVLIARELRKPAFTSSPTAQLFREMRAALRARAGLPP
ncbi:MAG: hypothetical protein ABJE95_03545 [Byssovorax sp.]